ncbi:MAG: preprotein translocase subunit SecG [Desulfuromonadales bacterium]|nr:preprotein translocase subunit SecG [Desulfuromonadales bacterium]
MDLLLLILHIVVCLALVGIVLLQGGKGAEVGATFGAGSSQTIFGAAGGQTFMGKLTTGAAIIFMLTSLALAIFWGRPGGGSVMPEQVAPATPPAQSMPAAPPAMPAPAPAAPAAQPK